MTIIVSSRAASLKNSSGFDLLFTSLNVWLIYLHILTNLCRSVVLYNSIAKTFCNLYDILFLRSSSNVSWLYSSKSFVNRWNSIQNVLKFLNDWIYIKRLYWKKVMWNSDFAMIETTVDKWKIAERERKKT
jgi:hypothetical protein